MNKPEPVPYSPPAAVGGQLNAFAEPAGAGRIDFFDPPTLAGLPIPPRRWLVDDLVPLATVTMLSGDGATGKSLLAAQLAIAVALGGVWAGRTVTAGRALFISAEDDRDELHRRLADIARAEGVSLAELGRLTAASLAGQDALMASLAGYNGPLVPSRLLDELEARIAAEKPTLVVLDTLADMFPGNENDRAQARQFIGLLRGVAIRHDCAVMLLAHPSLTGLNSGSGLSGSTAWNNSVRSRLYLERVIEGGEEANPDSRVLRVAKANYSRRGEQIGLVWRDGVFSTEAKETGLDRIAASAKAKRVFIQLLALYSDQGRRVNASSGKSYAPAAFAAHPASEGCTKRAFFAAMEALLANGEIVNVTEGPPSRRVSFLRKTG